MQAASRTSVAYSKTTHTKIGGDLKFAEITISENKCYEDVNKETTLCENESYRCVIREDAKENVYA